MQQAIRHTLPLAPTLATATRRGKPLVSPGALRAASLCVGALLAVPATFGQTSSAAGPAATCLRRRLRQPGPRDLRRAGRRRRCARAAGPRSAPGSQLQRCQRRHRAGRTALPVRVDRKPLPGSAAVDRRRLGQLVEKLEVSGQVPRPAGPVVQPGHTVLSPAAAFVVHHPAIVRFVVAVPSIPAWTDMQAKPTWPHRRSGPAMRSRT